MIAAGAGLMLGVKTKTSALGVAGFLALASANMHDFWDVTDPQQKQAELIQFSKNMALIGAALSIAGTES
jgi:putative oxidoreductase